MGNVEIFPPPEILKKYVRYIWALNINDDATNKKILHIFADKYPRLIFQDLDTKEALKQIDGSPLAPTFLAGIVNKYKNYIIEGSYAHVGVSFFPGAIKKLFGIDAFELVNMVPDIRDFYRFELNEQLTETKSNAEKVKLISDYLVSCYHRQYGEDFIVADFLRNHQQLTYKEVLKKYSISERQFQRRFYQYVGISPVMYKRLSRFENALSMLRNKEHRNTSDIAYELNYTDHSHFIREFKEFTGLTPNSFLKHPKIVEESSSFLSQI
ncbi:hypothetical protein C7T94_12585 [Pedobacter yulinensis]|uniref:HTH araC/xylS-type domain-containing protein n=1 Tax=Pedobacter yulinensis TaxID=2126353 RepID=A0A2T3HLW4_9SPHI|nr:helix-turn-helix domain-containing protein [Pedobacter yulinensis]PST83403.1 hypothetical protein C7T94_12585 [Pedobacter yulinensis]